MRPAKAPKSRVIGRYAYDDGRAIEITCSEGIDTAKALEIATSLIKLKQDEIGSLRRPVFKAAAE